jgi:hypothetical protein
MAIPPEEAERRCRRALMEAWIGRESATFRLPPSRLALDPADVIRLAHDGREVEFRLVSVADAEARGIEAVRQDRAAYDLPPGDPRPASLASPVVFGTPEVVMLDLPQISEDQPAHRPLIAAHASPWPGEIAVFRSASTDGFNLLTTFGSRARIGTLAFDFFPGPDLALRSGQRAGRRSPVGHAGERDGRRAVRRGECAGRRDGGRGLGDRPGWPSRTDRRLAATA